MGGYDPEAYWAVMELIAVVLLLGIGSRHPEDRLPGFGGGAG